MLSVSTYPKSYIDDCCRKTGGQIAAFNKLKGGAELKAFAPLFFNHMLLALDHYFNHRARGQEKKDGNPLNEVRMLANSIMENDAVLAADSTIKYDPGKAVLKLRVGDKIALDADAFQRISDAFFDDMKAKFS
jgi:hypothetical protein